MLFSVLLGVLGVVGAGAGVGLLVLPLDMPPGVLLPVLPPMLPLVLPPLLAPAPAPLRASRRQVSRCAPIRSLHLSLASTLVPSEPDALPPAAAPPLTPEPDVVPLAPVLPEVDPDVWAMVTEDRASSAAAVAAVSTFNIMEDLLRVG
ncbi:MAG TPA: hypothetical protein VIG70_04185 [Burkholderiales bacterium]